MGEITDKIKREGNPPTSDEGPRMSRSEGANSSYGDPEVASGREPALPAVGVNSSYGDPEVASGREPALPAVHSPVPAPEIGDSANEEAEDASERPRGEVATAIPGGPIFPPDR